MNTDIHTVMDQLNRYLDPFDEILRHGHGVYEGYPPEVVLDHDPSTQAHCINRHILAEAHRVLEDFGSVRHIEDRGQNMWLLEDASAIIRFKKTDENGVSSNYPTKRACDFERGEPLPGLPPEATRLNVGYLLDKTGIGFLRSQVALPVGRSTMWCAAIVPEAERVEDQNAWLDVTREPRMSMG